MDESIDTLFESLINDKVSIIIKLNNYHIYMHKSFELCTFTLNSMSLVKTDISSILHILESYNSIRTIKIILKYHINNNDKAAIIRDTLNKIRAYHNIYDISIKSKITYM